MQSKIQGDTFVETIAKSGLCAGCGLCEAIAPPGSISMKMSARGWLRPVVNGVLDRPTEALIAKVCPGAALSHPDQENHDVLWGPLVAVRTGHATDPEIRWRGSSGGAISALCLYLLDAKKVAFVAHIAAGTRDPLENELQLSRTRDDILNGAGSRYAPSAPLSSMASLLAQDETFAVVGKPCDIGALRQYARFNPRVRRLVPYMFSFMCAGIPSIRGTHAILEKLGTDASRLASFRYRGDGWPGRAEAVDKEGHRFSMDYNTSWGTILNRHLQFRCKVCADGTGEFADVTGADAWYGTDGYPDFSERDGRSLLLSRTSAGEALVLEAAQAGALHIEPLDRCEIEKMQPYQAERKRLVAARLAATWLVQRRVPRYRNLRLLKAARQVAPMRWLRHLAGTFRRVKGERE